MLRKLIGLNQDNLVLYAGVEVGVFLLLQIIMSCVIKFSGGRSVIQMTGLLLPIIAGVLILISCIAHVGITFPQAIAFGQTRRRSLVRMMAMILFESGFIMGLAVVMKLVEQHVSPKIWSALAGTTGVLVNGMDDMEAVGNYLMAEYIALEWYWYLIIFAIAAILGSMLGALIQSFGGRGAWIFWVIFLVCFLLTEVFQIDISAALIGNPTGILCVVVFMLGCLGWTIWSLLHAVVKQ